MNISDYNIIESKKVKPLVSFIGVGWIGLNRMKAIINDDVITVDSIADIHKDNLIQAWSAVPEATTFENLEEVVKRAPTGIVIATPSAIHASQSIYALKNGVSVFCQKPLGRTAWEVRNVVETARKYNKLLGVDFSYRLTSGMQKVYRLIKSGELGTIFAANLVFHNAYGPDKKWFYDPSLSGGGCVIDLGSHLIDLALWVLNFPEVKKVSSNLFSKGRPINNAESETEDYAIATIKTENEAVIQLACSWNLQTGQDAIIEATFYGTKGGATFRNLDGSFFDFEAIRFFSKTKRETISSPPDDWSGRAAVDWARRLSRNEGFNDEAFEFIRVAEVIDKIYKRDTL